MDRNEAIKIVKNHYPANKQMLNEALEFLIPELKESEDEKVRKLCKELIESAFMDELCNKEERDTCIAWLKKQGKQEQLYIRFGEIPTDEKSKIFQGEIEIGTENGVSVYPAFKTIEGNIVLGLNLPITKTTLYTQQHLIEYDNRPCYLVKGDYVGKDTDGQTLINNVSIIEKIDTYRIKEKKQDGQKEINLVEILKHYPRETELYSPLYGKLWLAKVDEKNEIITCYKYPLNKGCTRAILEQEDTVSFYSNGTTGLPDFNISKDCMLFLYDIEKQGEPKNNDKVEQKFKVGDWVVSPNGVYWHIDAIQNGRYEVTTDEGQCGNWPLDTNIYRLWTIKDAKDGDILFHSDSASNGIFIFKELLKCGFSEEVICYCDYDSEDGFCLGEHHTCCWADAKILHPATKEQRDLLFQKMKEAGYEWDEKKKELKIIEQTPAWSEEDDDNAWLNDIISKVENNLQLNKAEIDWLKSLKQRYIWKLNDEQIDALDEKMLNTDEEMINEEMINEEMLKNDEEMLKAAICLIKGINNDTCHGGFACNGIHKDDVINWLEDLLACY